MLALVIGQTCDRVKSPKNKINTTLQSPHPVSWMEGYFFSIHWESWPVKQNRTLRQKGIPQLSSLICHSKVNHPPHRTIAQPRLVMLERPPGGATMRWPERLGTLSSAWAPERQQQTNFRKGFNWMCAVIIFHIEFKYFKVLPAKILQIN